MSTRLPAQHGSDTSRFAALLTLLQRHRGEAAGSYDEVANVYDEFAAVWDGYVAAPAVHRVNELLQQWVSPGTRVLDAAAGTGQRTRAVFKYGQPALVVGLDASEGMLGIARRSIADSRASFLLGDLRALPFEDSTFDVVCCTWAIEILADPHRAVQEFVRVIKPAGIVIYAFCSLPEGPIGRVLDYVMHHLSSSEEPLTHLLAEADQPFHRCARSSLQRFSGGLTTVATVAKCCPISSQALPCIQTATV